MNVHCDKSPDGRHEVDYETMPYLGGGIADIIACQHCGIEFAKPAIVNFFNAALRLTGIQAHELAIEVHRNVDGHPRRAQWLYDYAAYWKGQDETD